MVSLIHFLFFTILILQKFTNVRRTKRYWLLYRELASEIPSILSIYTSIIGTCQGLAVSGNWHLKSTSLVLSVPALSSLRINHGAPSP